MAYAHTFIKLTFGGTIFEGKEIWSCGINLGREDRDVDLTGWGTDGGDYVSDMAAHVRDWFQDSRSGISYLAKLEWVKIAHIGLDGKYIGDPFIVDFATPYTGGWAVDVAPQLTVALSMKTTVRRGPGRDGRIYPPLTGTVDPRHGTDKTPLDKMESFKDFIEGLNLVGVRDASNPFYVIVASQGDKFGNGKINAEVKKVRVGNVIDTQRSRRNAIKEYYYEAEVQPDVMLDQHAP